MQNHKPHSQKAPQTGHSIFGTILFSLLAVLAVEFLLLTFAVHATRLGPQLNQNAEDILAMQVDNRSRYLQSIFHDAQELTSLSDAINGLMLNSPLCAALAIVICKPCCRVCFVAR